MDNKPQDWSKPDYTAWERGIRQVAVLPTPRFYFAVTVVALVMIATSLTYANYGYAGFFIAVMILLFGATAFFMQWNRECNDRQYEERKAESPNQPERTKATPETPGGE